MLGWYICITLLFTAYGRCMRLLMPSEQIRLKDLAWNGSVRLLFTIAFGSGISLRRVSLLVLVLSGAHWVLVVVNVLV